jgi:hypothetical protein
VKIEAASAALIADGNMDAIGKFFTAEERLRLSWKRRAGSAT